MPAAATHPHETARLQVLRGLQILDSLPEDSYDEIVKLACDMSGAAYAVINLVDAQRHWFKAVQGLELREIDRCEAFWEHALQAPGQIHIVNDATCDPVWKEYDVVKGLLAGCPPIRFYAGVPLLVGERRHPVGTLSVFSDGLLPFGELQQKTLTMLASHTESLLELRRAAQRGRMDKLLIDASHDAILAWIPEGGIVSWSRGAEEMYGYRREEVIGRTWMSLFQKNAASMGEVISKLGGEGEWSGEMLQETRDGEQISVLVHLQRVQYHGRQLIIATNRDITRTKRRERALSRAQQALDTAADAIFWVGPQGEVVYANESACRRLQYTRQELLAMRVTDIDPSMRQESTRLQRIETLMREKRDRFETTHLRKDGDAIPVEIASHLIEFEDETFACTFVRDISDRVRAQQAHEAVTAELKLIFETLPLAVVYTDNRRRITRVNPAFTNIFGYTENSVVGQATRMIYVDETGFQLYGREDPDAPTPVDCVPYEAIYRHRNGLPFTGETVRRRVVDKNGVAVGHVALIQDVSERAAASRKLAAVNEDRRAMVELLGTTDGVWAWRVGTNNCEFAPGFRKLLGFEGGDRQALPDALNAFTDRIHPDDWKVCWSVVEDSLSRRVPFLHEFRVRCADDSYIWVRARGNSIYNEVNQPTRMVGTIHDITKQKLAEQDREQFFNAGIQIYGVVDLDAATWIRLSPNWESVLGYTTEELLTQSFLQFAHPDDKVSYVQKMKQLTEGVPVRGFLARMQHRDQSYRWIEWNASPPESGQSTVYFTATDVTEADHDVVRKIADAVPVTLYIYDVQQKRFQFVNRHVDALLGYSPAQFLELGDAFFARFAHPEDAPRIANYHAAVRRGSDHERFDMEFRVQRADGSYSRLFCTDRVFQRSSDGTVQQIIGTATQLDDLRVLRRYLNDLETANKELEEFAYVASHDLKQPLRGIDNLAQWVEDDSGERLPSEAKAHLVKLRGRVGRMERLLDDLLAYSRIGRGSAPAEAFYLGQVVEELAELLSPPKSFGIQCLNPGQKLVTERIPFEQVLRNLIANAIKHRAREDGRVMVVAMEADDMWEISVQDDGPGIAPEYHDRIFRLFHTLRPRDEVEASGMGLSLAKKQVETRGGAIWVESDGDRGATFRFTWPKHPIEDTTAYSKQVGDAAGNV